MSSKYIIVKGTDLSNELIELGGDGIKKCYQCGTCTAICPLSKEQTTRVRRMIKKIQLGLEEEVLGDPTPWLCYFCGDCNETCPKDATPGNIMDAVRKYQIINYSIGKFAKVFYNKAYVLASLVIMTIIGLIGMYIFHGEMVTNVVDIDSFISAEILHDAGLVLLAYVIVVMLVHIANMYRYTKRAIGYGKKVPLSKWVSEFFRVLIKEALLQSRLLCEEGQSARYFAHIGAIWGFILLFAATGVHFISDSFGLGVPEIVPRVIGIIGGIGLLYGGIFYLTRRFEKKELYAKASHLHDWWLLSLALGSVISGFLTTIFMYANMAMATYIFYGIHLLFVFYLIVSAPFSKLVHAIYRPFALWFASVWEGEEL